MGMILAVSGSGRSSSSDCPWLTATNCGVGHENENERAVRSGRSGLGGERERERARRAEDSGFVSSARDRKCG